MSIHDLVRCREVEPCVHQMLIGAKKNSEVLNIRLAIGSAIASQSKSVIFRHCSKIFKFVTWGRDLPNLI